MPITVCMVVVPGKYPPGLKILNVLPGNVQPPRKLLLRLNSNCNEIVVSKHAL
jgi:hypothetical protein